MRKHIRTGPELHVSYHSCRTKWFVHFFMWKHGCVWPCMVAVAKVDWRWALCGLRGRQTATVTKVFCRCVCLWMWTWQKRSRVVGIRGQDSTRFESLGQQKASDSSSSCVLCTSLFSRSKGPLHQCVVVRVLCGWLLSTISLKQHHTNI